ncbi:hypothetical protein [Parasphingorhabdus cellanae]|uniref:Uncharacterized protein n=1 Tax=Parasphingorhabdus cellanae TaxID=2806553 RepID=A0ABX7T574_9SPHN|nr:hypothetical protein [Parasphingorhabdus cellanae]QTD56736.1 hypothetical protein J4G78_03925 [Parasphingorhabdus cellanae]
MLKPAEFLKDVMIHEAFQPQLKEWLKAWRLKTYVDILIVVDGGISISPNGGFGVGAVIDLIRSAEVGCMRFRIDLATRNGSTPQVIANPGPNGFKYTGFEFDMTDGGTDVIDKYEQIWCFGINPNTASTNDAIIDQASNNPTNDQELERLDQWMSEKKGGLFGTGDHHVLGASMCRKIPRLGTMRRWTNADGVPPVGSPDRIDTLRPPEPVANFQAGGPGSLSNGAHQGDLTVQPIRWTTWRSAYWPFPFRRKRPHPVLCHPTLGPIDVMPDHAHEGLCVNSPDLSATKQFNGDLEYPNAVGGGSKPEPQVIAFGSNLDSDDWNFSKGEQPGRTNNPMISVYDGHPADVGRVATDATWHHWMNVNIDQIKAADNDDWKKISRYFINLATWLNPPGFSTRCLYLSVVASHIEYPGFQEYYAKTPTLELGHVLRRHLKLYYGPCWVTERIWDLVWELELIPRKKLFDMRREFGRIDVDEEEFEALVLGKMVEATMKPAEQLKATINGDMKGLKALPVPEKLFAKPVAEALNAFAKDKRALMKVERDALASFKA